MFAPLARKLSLFKNPAIFAKGMSFWFPYLFAGIRVDRIDAGFRKIDVSMRQYWGNTNYVGTHFGGSLYAMTDPFYMLMIMRNLGRDYIVWDKAAAIDFLKPGKGLVTAKFRLEEEDLDRILSEVNDKTKTLWVKEVLVKDASGETVAKVLKTVYVRKKL